VRGAEVAVQQAIAVEDVAGAEHAGRRVDLALRETQTDEHFLVRRKLGQSRRHVERAPDRTGRCDGHGVDQG
jgi:hypothetical protein